MSERLRVTRRDLEIEALSLLSMAESFCGHAEHLGDASGSAAWGLYHGALCIAQLLGANWPSASQWVDWMIEARRTAMAVDS